MLNAEFKKFRERTLKRVRDAHGHVEGADDIDRLCLSISNMVHMNSERVATLKINITQAQTIARLEREKLELLTKLEGAGVDKTYLG